MAPVSYELVPPFTSFKFMLPEGEVLVDEKGLHTPDEVEQNDPRVLAELDAQTHAVRRKAGRS